ncbi:MAG: hypothetical protein RSC66_03860, partial [Comamonas sp.]
DFLFPSREGRASELAPWAGGSDLFLDADEITIEFKIKLFVFKMHLWSHAALPADEKSRVPAHCSTAASRKN